MQNGSIAPVLLSALLALTLGGACGGRVSNDAGSVRRDVGVDSDLASLDAPGLDGYVLPSADAGEGTVAACLDESRCVEHHDHPPTRLVEEEAECATLGVWHRRGCEGLPDVELAGGCRLDLGGPYEITWFRAPEFMESDVRSLCMVAGATFVAAR